MVQTCSRCSRVNPPEAAYCYFDGSVLDGRSLGTGPLATGTQPFPSDFVFPSGRRCRTFDELAVACQEEWPQAVDMLQKGYLEGFLGGLGRTDLAQAAREAASFPDRDRALDQLLTKLPSDVLEPPRLQVEPREINLGLLQVGEDRQLELQLSNVGTRLLHGSLTCDDALWIALGEAPGGPQKLFQFTSDWTVPVQVRGQHLRASAKRLEARLLVESNGGTAVVMVRAEVPIKPFADGVLAGATTPRQIAHKAKAAPKEAALLFEGGAVADWYKQNGWTYPVQGPAASGVGAVQQFFEALGLTPPPKVEINQTSVKLQGNVGDPVQHALEVKTPEKRPVYAHATSDQAWLTIGRPQLNGRTATIPLLVPAVPDREGETLTAEVTVTANGNQRFVVPVTLEVGGSLYFGDLAGGFAPPKVEKPSEKVEKPSEPEPTRAPESGPAPVLAAPVSEAPAPAVPKKARRPLVIPWKHLVPAALLAVVLGAGIVWDAVSKPAPSSTQFEPLLGIQFDPRTLRFGIAALKEKDPNDPNKHKRLTSDPVGKTNNTCIRLDDKESLFGLPPGKPAGGIEVFRNRRWTCTWDYPDKVRVRQIVEIVRGEQTRLWDTCLVRYLVQNLDTQPHKVGLRVMIDTFIGDNDGVPFVIPGQPGLLETMQRFDQKDIPDFIQAVERSDLKDPGTVAQMGLRLQLPGSADSDLEPIEALLISRWPNNSEARWDWEPAAMNDVPPGGKKDSCVTLYWAYRNMPPQEKREMAFTYGLGELSSTGGGRLAMTVGGSSRPHGTFTVTAYVKNPEEGQKVTLRLPAGLSLLEGQSEQQTVKPEKDYSQVSWRVRSGAAGDYLLEAESGGMTERYTVRIKETSIFD